MFKTQFKKLKIIKESYYVLGRKTEYYEDIYLYKDFFLECGWTLNVNKEGDDGRSSNNGQNNLQG